MLKLILLIAGAALVGFGLLLWYVLSPTVRDVSGYPAVAGLLHRPLLLRRPAWVVRADPGMYQLRRLVLTEFPDLRGTATALPPNTPLTLTGFKSYTNGVSGFTHLVGLGTVPLPNGTVAEVEYDWGSIDRATFTRRGGELPLARPLWEPAALPSADQ